MPRCPKGDLEHASQSQATGNRSQMGADFPQGAVRFCSLQDTGVRAVRGPRWPPLPTLPAIRPLDWRRAGAYTPGRSYPSDSPIGHPLVIDLPPASSGYSAWACSHSGGTAGGRQSGRRPKRSLKSLAMAPSFPGQVSSSQFSRFTASPLSSSSRVSRRRQPRERRNRCAGLQCEAFPAIAGIASSAAPPTSIRPCQATPRTISRWEERRGISRTKSTKVDKAVKARTGTGNIFGFRLLSCDTTLVNRHSTWRARIKLYTGDGEPGGRCIGA
jgi:hypothetical protein